MRFYLDEDLSWRIAVIARRLGVDVVSSSEYGRNGLTDEEQLRLAAEDGRCVVTENYPDFSRLTMEFQDRGLPHAGVALVPRSLPRNDFAGIAEAIAYFDTLYPEGLAPYTVDNLHN